MSITAFLASQPNVVKMPRRMLRIFRNYGPSFRHNLHIKLALANFMCAPFPDFVSGPWRSRMYRLAGFDIDPRASIMNNIHFVSGLDGFYDKLHVGPGSVIGRQVTINLDEDVRLGTNVSISPHVLIYTGSHRIGPGSNRMLPGVVAAPVILEDGCWIGLGAIILPGVTVGRGSIIGAGAVVSQDVPPNTYVEGNPAKVVRNLPWGDR